MDGPGCAGSRTSRGAISAGSPGKAGIMKRLAREARQMAVHRLCALRNPGLRTYSTRSGCFAIMLATLSGCGLAEVERAWMETGDVARQVSALRGSGASAPGAPQAGPRLSTVRLIERRPYVGLTPIEPDPRADLPARYRRADAVTLPLAGIGAVATLAGRIEAATGLAVRFTGPARQAGNSTVGDPSVNVFGEAVRDGLSPDGGIWTGPLDALLDSWTEPYGYEWRYDADRQAIEIVRRRSAIFQIHALAGKQHYTVSSSTQDSAAGGDGEGSGGGNLTSQTISTETDYDPWPEIEGQLKGLLDPGTRLSVAPSSASVTVSGTPRDIARARAYLGYLNREVLRPVTLSVHVYSVRVEREADYDLGLSFSIARLLGEALRVSVGSNAVALIKPSPGGESGDTLSAAVRALNSAGAVSRVLSADIPSLNGKPAQFFELFQESYLRELRTTAGDGIAQTELVPGTVSSGFAVSYLPRITGPGEVLVRLFASLRDRPSFTAFTSNNQTIQLPAYASRAIQVTQKIGRGETLMVTGFSDRSASAQRSGTFDADLPLPDGGRKASTARIEQVLLIPQQGGDLRHPVQGRRRDPDHHRPGPQAPRRPDRPYRRAAHLGLGADPSPAPALHRAGWRPFSRWRPLDLLPAGLLPARARAVAAVPTLVPGQARGGPRCRPPALLRQLPPPCRCAGLRRLSRSLTQGRMGGLRQAPLRRPRGGARLSQPLHPPRRHRQQPPDQPR